MTRRTAVRLLGSGAGIALLAGCLPSPDRSSTTAVATPPAGGATPAPGTPPASSAPPRTGGTLRFGNPTDINRLDPHFRINDIYYQVYDRLTQYDVNLNPQPMLAESWDISDNYQTITFNLRRGVTFHNGRELDAQAVRFNSERARDLPNTQLDEAKWWTQIDTPDKYTVIFRSNQPRPLAFDFFEYLNIAEPDSADTPTTAVGTGPFKFVEWRQGQSMTLSKNADYWLTGQPYMDGIVMSVMTDPQSMVARFEAGDLDAAVLPVTDFLRLRNDPRFEPYLFSSGNVAVLGVHCQTPPFDTKRARQALLYAVDRGRWANTVNHGLETPSSLPWTENSLAYDAVKANAYPFDLARAKSMLTEAGVTTPVNLDLLIQTGNAEYQAFAQILQNDFAELGITLRIRPLETAAYLNLINNWNYAGFWLGGGSFTHLDPATAFTKSRAFSPTGNSSAFTEPANADAVALLERATTVTGRAQREQIYDQLNDMLLDEVYLVGLSPTTNRLLTTSKLQGIAPTLHSSLKWWQVWFSA